MNRIDLDVFRDDKDLRYAYKHRPEAGLVFHGQVITDHFRDGRLIQHCDQGPNTFTTEGMARILNIVFRQQATEAAIYCGIFKNNVVPALGDTALTKLGAAGTYGECQDADYTPLTNRPAYVMAATTTAQATNAASPAGFTIVGNLTVYGAFLASSQAKTATAGTLFCAKGFASPRAVIADDILSVTYVISATTS